MAKQTRLTAQQSQQRRRLKVKRQVARKPTDELDQLPIASLNGVRHNNSIEAQAAQLTDSRLGVAQRQALALQIGRVQGNRHLQRVMTTIQQTGPGSASPLQRQPAAAEPTVRLGSNSPAVATLQQQLNGAGASLTVDGVFGGKTQQAVLAFQKAAGLSPDGIVGPKTWGSLKAGGVTLPAVPGPAKSDAAAGSGPNAQQAAMVAAKLGQIKMLLQAVRASEQGAATPEVDNKAPAEPLGRNDAEEEESIFDSVTSWAEEQVSGATSWVGEQVDSATDWAEEQVSGAASWVGEQVSGAASWVGEQVDSATDWAEEQVSGAAQWVGETAATVSAKVDQAVEAVTEVATEVKDEVAALGDELRERYSEELAILDQVVRDIGRGLGLDPATIKALDDFLQKLKEQVTGSEEEEDQPEQGPVSDSLPPIQVGSFSTAGCDQLTKLDAIPAAIISSQPALAKHAGKRRPIKADIRFVPVVTEQEASGSQPHLDSVRGNMYVESQVTRGGVKNMQGFGREEVAITLDNITWTADDDLVVIQARLFVDAHWDVNSQGRTNISGPNDPAVDPTNWDKVTQDLTPDDSGQPPRRNFWAQDLTETHEQFHASDDISKAQSFLIKKNLAMGTKTIDIPWWITESDKKKISFKVNLLLKDVAAEANTAVQEHYNDGGEKRAYAVGKAAYEQRVAEIKKRAAAETWPEWE